MGTPFIEADPPYSTFVTHRPRRVAFLVDFDEAANQVLRAIMEFSIDCWGGRYNLVIPTINGAVYEDYWKLLGVADPDVVYCYSEIDGAIVERLDRHVGPTRILKHRRFSAGPKPDFAPSLGDQVSTSGLILGLHESIPAHLRKPQEPSILCFDHDRKHKETEAISAFVRTNFGVSHQTHLLVRDHGVNGKAPDDYSNAAVMDCIARTMNLLLPLHLCAHAPLVPRAGSRRVGDEFLVCLGESAWNIAYFWAYVYFRDPKYLWYGGIDQMWIPDAVLKQPEEYRAFLNLIAKRVYTSGRQREIRIVSYDHDAVDLAEVAKRICSESRANLYPGETERLACGSFPAVEYRSPFQSPTKQPRHQHLRGREVFIEIQKPENVLPEPDQVWMMDLRIEDPYQERFFPNMEAWWKLPTRSSLAKLFSRPRPSRVSREREVSVEVGATEQSVKLSVPPYYELFRELLLPETWYTTVDDLRHPTARRPSKHMTLSDKGKYLNGLVTLAGSLREATYFFEHPYWRGILEALCRPQLSEQVRGKISKDVAKELSGLIREGGKDANVVGAWLTEKIVEAAQRIPRGDNPMSYAEMEKRRLVYIDALDSQAAKEQARSADLKSELAGLTRTGVLLQGIQIRCASCMSKFWYHVDEIGKIMDCRGCRAKIPLPAEPEWAYQPNELLRAAMRYHGVVPVLRTIRRLFERARECFVFLAGVQFYAYKGNEPVFTDELDLCWLEDGQFGIAEVKQSTKLFSSSDYENLADIADVARPDVVLIAAAEGEDQGLEAGRQKLTARLTSKGVGATVEAWGPSAFTEDSLRV
jgi:hypothetical protein